MKAAQFPPLSLSPSAGISRSPHPSSALHFPTTSILPQGASTYFPHTAIRYPPHLNPQDPLKDLVSLACDPSNQQPGPVSIQLNGGGQVKVPGHYLSTQMLAPPPPGMPRLAISPDTKSTTTTSEGGTTSPTSPSKQAHSPFLHLPIPKWPCPPTCHLSLILPYPLAIFTNSDCSAAL
ncbi:hypothetical protein Chor_017170 [Crotalus horridus]